MKKLKYIKDCFEYYLRIVPDRWISKRKMIHCTRFHQSEPYKYFMGYSLFTGHHPVKCNKCGSLKYVNSRGEWYQW
jgi:hypothetical protein